MYQVTVTNQDKTIKKGENLTFTIANFPPNTRLEFFISPVKNFKYLGGNNFSSDANGGGIVSTTCENPPGKYRLSVRNTIYGIAHDIFTVA